MLKNDKAFGVLPEGVNLISNCPICNVKYNPLQLRILEEKKDSHLVYIKCSSCQAGVVAVIMSGGIGVTSIGLITDLSAEDVIRFKDVKEISLDEVLEMHELLEKETKSSALEVFMQ